MLRSLTSIFIIFYLLIPIWVNVIFLEAMDEQTWFLFFLMEGYEGWVEFRIDISL